MNKHFKTVRSSHFSSLLFFAFRFRAFCVVVVVPLQPQFRHFAANRSSFSYFFFGENSTGFDVIWIIVCLVLCLLCSCRVSLQPQSRQSPVIFFVLIFVFFFCENSTGFRVIFIFVRFVLCLLCSCRVSLQPQFHQSVFLSEISSFALCCDCCVVVESHSSHSFAISRTG